MKKKHLKGYSTIKEARKECRNVSKKGLPVPIYIESDGSYSIIAPKDGKASFVEAVDYSGKRYRLIWSRDFGKKRQIYVEI